MDDRFGRVVDGGSNTRRTGRIDWPRRTLQQPKSFEFQDGLTLSEIGGRWRRDSSPIRLRFPMPKIEGVVLGEGLVGRHGDAGQGFSRQKPERGPAVGQSSVRREPRKRNRKILKITKKSFLFNV